MNKSLLYTVGMLAIAYIVGAKFPGLARAIGVA